MTTVKGPAQGSIENLVLSPEPPSRFMVGLAWDPKKESRLKLNLPEPLDSKAGTMDTVLYYLMKPVHFVRILLLASINLLMDAVNEKLHKKTEDARGRDRKAVQHDLDLDCYIFDKDMNLLRVVGTENDNYIDPSRKIYHSGEDFSGSGGPDDEQISVETKGIPDNYHHFFFTVMSDSQQSFEDINNPVIRLADGKTNNNFLENKLSPSTGRRDCGYIFCHVFRQDNGWKLKNIDKFLSDGVEMESYIKALR